MSEVTQLALLVREERRLSADIGDLKDQHTEIRRMLQEELESQKLEKVEVGKFNVSMVRPKPSVRLIKSKLISAGVTPDQLAKGSEESIRAPYVTVRPRPEEKE